MKANRVKRRPTTPPLYRYLFQQFTPYAFRLCSCRIALHKRPHPEFGVLHAACDKTLSVVKAFGHHLGDVLAALFSFFSREASELPQQKHDLLLIHDDDSSRLGKNLPRERMPLDGGFGFMSYISILHEFLLAVAIALLRLFKA